MFAPLGFVPGINPQQVAAVAQRGNWAKADVPTIDHYMKLGAWFAGTPQQLVERIQELNARYPGMEHINLSTPMGTPLASLLAELGSLRRVGWTAVPDAPPAPPVRIVVGVREQGEG